MPPAASLKVLERIGSPVGVGGSMGGGQGPDPPTHTPRGSQHTLAGQDAPTAPHPHPWGHPGEGPPSIPAPPTPQPLRTGVGDAGDHWPHGGRGSWGARGAG